MNTAAIADTVSTESARRIAGWRWFVLGAAAVYMVLLFVVWPYQHWSYAQRGSVFEGWFRVLLDQKHTDWIFCLAVPPIAGWLVYRERAQLRGLSLNGSWWGALVLLFAALCYWAGYKVDTGYLGYAALQLSVAGLILLLGGFAWMRALFLPWFFLVFAWPFFPLDDLLAARLKIPTARVAAQILSLTGVDIVREGSTIVSAANPLHNLAEGQKFRLDVSNDCSGMRSLYALITAAVLYAIIDLRGIWPRVVLIASAIPLAVAGNVVRLLLLAWGSLFFGQEFAVGRMIDGHEEASSFHMLAGVVVFGVALAGMFGLATLLERGRRGRKKTKPPAEAPGPPVAASISSPVWKCTFALGLAAVSILLCWTSPVSATLADPGLSIALPQRVGEYEGVDESMSLKERSVFDPGVELVRRRYLAEGHSITATIVLSGTVKKTLHRPENCLPDAGWHISRSETVPVTLANGKKIDASLMHIFCEVPLQDGGRVRLRALHLYWYHGSHGVSTATYDGHNFITYRDAILRNMNHRWCQVSLYTMLPPSSGMESMVREMAAQDELIEFAGKISSTFVKD